MSVVVDDFLNGLSAATSIDAVWKEILFFFNGMGFEWVNYGYTVPGVGDEAFSVRVLSNFPGWYQESYEREDFSKADPVVAHCVSATRPRYIGLDCLDGWPDIDDDGLRITKLAAEAGMRSGVVFPLRSPGPRGLAGLSVSGSMRFRELERHFSATGDLLRVAAVGAHAYMQLHLERPAPGPSIHLTPRESECLRWTARGLSAKQIGRQLGLSDRTVESHLGKAMAKLGAVSRAQAVATAMTAGFIHL